jgi:hypothetical protein
MDPVAVPLAHQAWFEPAPPATDWAFLAEGRTLLLLAGALAVVGLVRLANRFRDGIDIPFLARAAPWMPFAIRLHLAVSLVGMLSLGAYLSPAMDLETTPLGILLGTVAALTAVGMAVGYRTRYAAALLIVAGPLGMIEFGIAPVLQRVDLLGMALFLLILGPGRWSADHELGTEPDHFDWSPEGMRRIWEAVLVLRVAAGAALIVVAMHEKLLNPDYALEFLEHHPDLHLARHLDLPLSDIEFVRVAGAIEVLFGLLLISGALPQAIVVIAGIPFNVTLWFFGVHELVGHLPVYGAMLLILIFGCDPRLRPLVYRFRPPEPAAADLRSTGRQ